MQRGENQRGIVDFCQHFLAYFSSERLVTDTAARGRRQLRAWHHWPLLSSGVSLSHNRMSCVNIDSSCVAGADSEIDTFRAKKTEWTATVDLSVSSRPVPSSLVSPDGVEWAEECRPTGEMVAISINSSFQCVTSHFVTSPPSISHASAPTRRWNGNCVYAVVHRTVSNCSPRT